MSDLLFKPGNLTIMVIDDHDPIRKGIKRILTAMEFNEVVECFDGNEAIKIIAKKPIDLIICDLYMRQGSGFEVLENVRNRQIGSDIPIIIVTGEASKEEIVKAADMGAEDYVLKPFQAADLEKKVAKVLNKFYSPTPLLKTLRQAERHFLLHEYQLALPLYDACLKLEPESMRAVHGKALTLEKLGKSAEALELLRHTTARNQTYHRNFAALADIHLRQNQVKDAIEALRKELEINSKQPERHIHLAKLLLKQGDALGASEHYRLALKDNPKRREALLGMGHALALADNLEKALYYFKRVRRYHPTATAALEAAVRYSLSAGDPRKAELLLKDEKNSHPERLDVRIVLCKFYLNQKRDDDGLAVLDEVLAKDPENSMALNLKGMTFLRRKDFVKAIESLEIVVRVAPNAENLFAIGEAYLGLDQLETAMSSLHKGMTLNSGLPHGIFLLAEAHKRSKQWIKAYYLFRRAAALGASNEACQAEARYCHQQIVQRRPALKAAS